MRQGGNYPRPARGDHRYDDHESEGYSGSGSDSSEIEFPVVRAPVRRPALGEFFTEQKDSHALFDLSDDEEHDGYDSEESEVMISSPEHLGAPDLESHNKNQYAPPIAGQTDPDSDQEPEQTTEQSTEQCVRRRQVHNPVQANNSSQDAKAQLALARAARERDDIRRGVTGYEMLRAPVDATVPRLPKAQVKAVLNAELEERMMPIVLKHLPSFATAAKRNDVWEQIARDSRGRYFNGNGARRHLIYLTKVLDDPTHVEHHKITPKLKEMLLTFQKNGFQGSKKLRKRKHSREASEQSAGHAEQEQEQEQFSAQHRSRRDQGQTTRKSPPPLPTLSREEWLSVRCEMDEPLLRALLQIRPFDYCAYKQRPQKWKEVITVLNHPRVPNSTIGSKRVRWLLGVFHNPSHAEYPRMSPVLRELLTEYKDAVAKSEFTISTTTSASPSPSNATTTKSRDTTLPADAEKAPNTINKAQEKAEMAAEPVDSFTTSAAYRDQVLLLEILRLRPFHMKRTGERIPMWDRVARNVRRQIGSTLPAEAEAMFATGEACMYRMKKLLSAVRNPLGKSSVTVPREQLKILKLLDKVVRLPPRRTTMEQAEVDVYVALDKQVETLLAKYPQRNATTKKPPRASPLKTPVVKDTEGRKQEDRHREEMMNHKHKRRRVETPRSSTLDEIHALQTEVTQLFASTATREAAVSNQIGSLQGNVALCHAQLTVEGTKLASERRAHREELLAMFEQLKREHETRERESEAVLQRIRKERRDRKREFAAILDRVKASIVPQKE